MNSLPLTENGFDQVNSETVVCNGVFDDIPAGTAVESEDWRRFFNNGSLEGPEYPTIEDMEFYDEKTKQKYSAGQSNRNNNRYSALGVGADKGIDNHIFEDLISIVDAGNLSGHLDHQLSGHLPGQMVNPEPGTSRGFQSNPDMLQPTSSSSYLHQSSSSMAATGHQQSSSQPMPVQSTYSHQQVHNILGSSPPPSRNTSIQSETQGESSSNQKKLFYSSLGYTSVPGLRITERAPSVSPSGQGNRTSKSPVSGRLSCSPPIRTSGILGSSPPVRSSSILGSSPPVRSGIRRLSGGSSGSPTRGNRARRKSCEQKMSCSPTGSSLPSWPAPSVPNPAGCWSPIATPHPISSLPPGHTSTWSPAESTSSGYLCSITTSTGSSTSSWSASLPPSSSWSRTPTHQTDNLSPLTEKSVARLTPVGATNVGIGSSGQHISLPGTLHNRSLPNASTSVGGDSLESNGFTMSSTLDRLVIGATSFDNPNQGEVYTSSGPSSSSYSRTQPPTTNTTPPSSSSTSDGHLNPLPRQFLTPPPVRPENSILRQQLQGNLTTRQNETVTCRKCNKMLTVKCIMGTCLKSDEVLCQSCNMELTVKCILGSCKTTTS